MFYDRILFEDKEWVLMFEYKESNILLMIEALKKIIKIFLGPFLTAYFIKVSADSLVDISLYYIFNYLILYYFF